MTEMLNEGTGLTRNQFLIWLGQEAAPDTPIYNELSVFVLPCEIDVVRFHRSFDLMLQESDALRTRVKRVHGRPSAETVDDLSYESGVLDLCGHDDVEGSLDAWARAQVDSNIDLSVRPFESTLIRLAPGRYAWGLLLHQLFSDATSMAIVFERVGDHYLRLADQATRPAIGRPSFAAYVDRELDDIHTADYRDRAIYWRAKVTDPPDQTVFYGGRSASTHPSPRRHRIDHTLGPELTSAVRAFANTEGVRLLSDHLSSFSVYCTALATYLHKLSGNGRVGIGTTWQNRLRPFESTVGLFMEQNPFEVQVEPDDTFRTLLKKVQAEALAAMRHLPYAAGNPGGRAYDVTLNYLKVSLDSFAGRPVDHRWYRPTFGDGSMHLQVHDVTDSEEVTLSFDLNEEIFTSDDHGSVIAHYRACLMALLENPDEPIGSVCILTRAELEKLERWNNRVFDYPRDATVVDLVEGQASRRPYAVAASCGDDQITYEELQKRVSSLSCELQNVGVHPGAVVGILLNRSVDLLVGILSVLRAGGAYVPLDPAFPRERLEYMLDDSGARALLTETRLVGSMGSAGLAVVTVDLQSPRTIDPSVPGTGVRRPVPEDLAYILYTSGSTGRPKGVAVPHRALTNFLWSMAREPGCDEGDRLLAVTTLSFDIAGLELFLPLIVGGHAEIAPREIVTDGRLLRAHLDGGQVTILQATPPTWRMLLDAGWTGSPGLKALVGGEALPSDLVQPLLDRTAALWNMYGPTETTIWSSVQHITSAQEEITIGHPIANTGFHVVDASLQPVPIGIAGELLISGDGLAQGYHERPELTAEKFIEVLSRSADSPIRMYRTGDMARFREDGRVVHLGRLDHQVKIRGFRIELGEIETILAQHGSVQQCVVVAHEPHTAAACLVAYYVPADASEATPSDLRRHLRASVPEYMVPQVFVPLPDLPLTLNGKIDRLRLPPPDLTNSQSSESPAHLSPMEARVADAFCEVLALPSVTTDADFFDLGGQSILALRLVSRISDQLGVEVPLHTLFEASTVSELSRRLSALTSTTPELRTIRLEGIDLEQQLADLWHSAVGAEAPPAGSPASHLTDAEVVKLLTEVRRQFGVAAEGLSALDFRSDPSVPALARALQDALNPPQALVVPLQPHGASRPLFLIHAGGGYVFFYRALAARLAPERPVYAVRAATRRDSHRNRFDHATSIEELAAKYIDEIKSVQPNGPYHLGGACFGGVVAFEMAQQLCSSGDSVDGPVLLFDSFVGKIDEDWADYTSRAVTSVAQRLGVEEYTSTSELVRAILTNAIRHPVAALKLAPLVVRSLYRRARDVLREAHLPDWLRGSPARRRSSSAEQDQLDTMSEFLATSLRLVSKYEPKPYVGAAVLLKAATGLDPEPLWAPWVNGGLDVHVRPGEHLEMMEEPAVADTASIVRGALRT